MAKLKPETLAKRRDHILDAAEACFARHGFHSTSMQLICREAGVSAGAIYTYFASKEELIAGICERDRAEFLELFSEVAAADDFLVALEKVATHYFVEEEREKLALVIETGAESTRNEDIRATTLACDRAIGESFATHLRQLADKAAIDPVMAPDEVAQMLQLIGDGMLWRRAVDPAFDVRTVMPNVMKVVEMLVRPQPGHDSDRADADNGRSARETQ